MSAEFLESISQGDFDRAKTLLNETPSLANASDENGMTALMEAAIQGNSDFLTTLLSLNPDLELIDNFGRTAIFFAAGQGNLDAFKLLVEKGASLAPQTTDGKSLSHFAGFSGNLELLKYLHSLNIDLTASDPFGKNALEYASGKNSVDEIISFITSLGIETPVNESEINNIAATFLETIKEGNVDEARTLLESYPNLSNASDETGSALIHAIIQNDNDFIKLLLQFSPDLEQSDQQHRTALLYAALHGNLEIVKLLVEKGADLTVQNNAGLSVSHFSGASGNLDLLKYLHSLNIDLTARDPFGNNAIHYASKHHDVNDVDSFIASLGIENPEITSEGINNESMPDISQRKIYDQLVKYSVLNGFDQSLLNDTGNCGGMSELYAYYTSIGREDEFYNILNYISSWDGNIESLKTAGGLSNDLAYFTNGTVKYKNGEELFEQMISNIALLQTTNLDEVLPELSQYNRKAQMELITNNETGFKSFFGIKVNKSALDSVSAYIDIAARYPGLTINISAFDKEEGHQMAIYVTEDNQLKFYDSNFPSRITNTISSDTIANYAQKQFDDLDSCLIEFSQFFDPNQPNVIINGQQLLTELANIIPNIEHEIMTTAFAIYKNDLEGIKEVTELLKSSGIPLKKEYLNSKFILAAHSGNVELINFFIEIGADINFQDINGNTALHVAAQHGNIEVFNYLLENGSKFTLKNSQGDNILHCAAASSNTDFFQHVIDKADELGGIYLDDANNNGVLPIHLAAKSGNVTSMQLIPTSGELNYIDANGKSVLDYAIESQSIEAITYAIKNRLGSLHADPNGHTVLHINAMLNKSEALTSLPLLEKYLELKDTFGMTALHYAAEFGNVSFIQKSLAAGANINALDKNGATPLHLAISSGRNDAVEALVNANANIFIANNNGTTALDLAVHKGNIEAIKLFLSVTNDKDVRALLEEAAEIIQNRSATLATPEPMDIELTLDNSLVANAFKVSVSDLKKEVESLEPKNPSQSARVQMVFSSLENGESITPKGMERNEQLQQLATLLNALSKESISDVAANNAYNELCAIKEQTTDPCMAKLCEKYTAIIEKEKPLVSRKIEESISEEVAKPSKLR